MRMKENEDLAKRVIQYYLSHANSNKLETCQHFSNEGKSKATIYGIIRRYEETKIVGYRKPKSFQAKQLTKRKLSSILRLYESNPSLSVCSAAKCLNIPKSTLQHGKRNVLGIKAYVKQKAPKYIKDQKAYVKTGL